MESKKSVTKSIQDENFEIYNKVENAFSVKLWSVLTSWEAEYLSNRLTSSPTVESRSPEWLLDHTSKHPSISVYDWEKIIWFITVDLYPVDYHWKNVHERI